MRFLHLSILAGLSALSLAAQSTPQLTPVGTYNTGLGADGAEIISVREKDNLGALTNIGTAGACSIDILDLSDPANIQRIRRVDVSGANCGSPNSVALHPHEDYFLVVCGRSAPSASPVYGKIAAYRISDGAFLASATVGIQPDSVAISPNGQYAVVANEAEGYNPSESSAGAGDHGGPGSLSLIRLTGFNTKEPGTLDVTGITLTSASGIAGFSTGRKDDLARVAIDNTPNTLEPESVAFSEDSKLAYITLQENNGVVILDLETEGYTYIGLGLANHLADLTTGGVYNPTEVLNLYREPDGIAVFTGNDDVRYFVTADEGDTRNGAGNSAPRGGRTVSVFNAATGALMGDTGKQLDDAANADSAYPDSRSNRGGSEPEVLDVAKYKGRILVAVGLERAARVALVDVTDPEAPTVIDLAASGLNPEGIKFYKVNGNLYVLSANEVSGTVSAFAVK